MTKPPAPARSGGTLRCHSTGSTSLRCGLVPVVLLSQQGSTRGPVHRVCIVTPQRAGAVCSSLFSDDRVTLRYVTWVLHWHACFRSPRSPFFSPRSQGASISQAFLSFQVGGESYCENVNLVLDAEIFLRADRSATASRLSLAEGNITARPRTTTVVTAQGASLVADLMFQGAGGNEYTAPDLADVVQELVSQGDWPVDADDQTIVLIIEQAPGAEHPIWRPMGAMPRLEVRYAMQAQTSRCICATPGWTGLVKCTDTTDAALVATLNELASLGIQGTAELIASGFDTCELAANPEFCAYSYIRDLCPATCGQCAVTDIGTPTRAPTRSPTLAPSPALTIGTALQPTVAPITVWRTTVSPTATPTATSTCIFVGSRYRSGCCGTVIVQGAANTTHTDTYPTDAELAGQAAHCEAAVVQYPAGTCCMFGAGMWFLTNGEQQNRRQQSIEFGGNCLVGSHTLSPTPAGNDGSCPTTSPTSSAPTVVPTPAPTGSPTAAPTPDAASITIDADFDRSSSADAADDDASNAGTMAGIVLAVLAVILLLGFALYSQKQRRRHAQERAETAMHRTENEAFGLGNDAPAASGHTATVPPMHHSPALGQSQHLEPAGAGAVGFDYAELDPRDDNQYSDVLGPNQPAYLTPNAALPGAKDTHLSPEQVAGQPAYLNAYAAIPDGSYAAIPYGDHAYMAPEPAKELDDEEYAVANGAQDENVYAMAASGGPASIGAGVVSTVGVGAAQYDVATDAQDEDVYATATSDDPASIGAGVVSTVGGGDAQYDVANGAQDEDMYATATAGGPASTGAGVHEGMYQLASDPLGGVEGDYDNPNLSAFDKSRASIRNPTYDVADEARGTAREEPAYAPPPVYALGQGSADEDMCQLASDSGEPLYDAADPGPSQMQPTYDVAEAYVDSFPDDGYLDIVVTAGTAQKTDADAVLEAMDGTGTMKLSRKNSFC